ncbi:MAG TPA: DUF4286 family protein [Ginsengibacter sp.]|nr:DUF4286 family protein [Chitinophagaceae bacterium]MCZ2395230.1 DUF4286 family protein [Chitinophagales bacterium]HRN72188.1 DUF4286 family protein [Ginsengibacter sp.]HRP17599.1 DUF4286 family protein [Ginsengibacter sp.]HRP43572.1 DUF4286 family protein [Ginsengibacter sp.]
MYTLNMTFKVEHDIYPEWKEWMDAEFIPAFLSLGDIAHTQLHQLMGHDDEQGTTMVLQVGFRTEGELRRYLDNFQSEFHGKVFDLWGEKAVFFQTVMKQI